jgi:hypothetical protein
MRAVQGNLGHPLEERRREVEGICAVEDHSAPIPEEVTRDLRRIGE